MVMHHLSKATQKWLADPVPFCIGGQLVTEGDLCALVNPATEREFAHVFSATATHVDQAVTEAQRAFRSSEWAGMNPTMRARIMWRLADLIEAHAEELGELETLCMGKPFKTVVGMDIPYFAETFRYFAGWCTKINGNNGALSFPAGDLHGMTFQDPVGVVGMVLPWNGPLVIGGWKIAPALATGCTCVINPAVITPLSLLRFAELAKEAGLPDGVMNIVTGRGSVVGAAIGYHDGIDKLAFTGSTGVGREIVKASADSNLKRLSLELGGKSPVIVFPDADFETALAGAADAIFGNCGQVCVAGSRLYVHNDIREAFIGRMVEKARSLKLGDPFEDTTDLGPLSSRGHCDEIARRVAQGRAQGGELVCGGVAPPGAGAFFPPTILAVDDQTNPLIQEEIFGPVLVVGGFDTEQDAIALANGTDYALAGSVWTRDIDRALRMSRAIHAGIVWINMHNVPDLHMPIGGHGQSGWGRELGQLGLSEYLQTKSVMIRIAGKD